MHSFPRCGWFDCSVAHGLGANNGGALAGERRRRLQSSDGRIKTQRALSLRTAFALHHLPASYHSASCISIYLFSRFAQYFSLLCVFVVVGFPCTWGNWWLCPFGTGNQARELRVCRHERDHDDEAPTPPLTHNNALEHRECGSGQTFFQSKKHRAPPFYLVLEPSLFFTVRFAVV